MIDSAAVNVKDFGAVGDGATDDTSAITAALQAGQDLVYFPEGTYAMESNVSITIAHNLKIFGEGYILYTGATDNTVPLFTIEHGNNSVTVDGLSFDGDNKVCSGIRLKNTATPSSNTLPNCTVSNNLFIRFKKNVSSGAFNEAVYIEGSYQLVTIANNRVRLISRAAGTGTIGSVGTSGIVVTKNSDTKYIRECLHYGNQYSVVNGGDAIGSADNVDYDGFKFFGPDPSANSGSYSQSYLTSYGNTYRNCRGRALKIQSIGSVRDETIIRDDDYTINGGSVEINFQYGVGMVSNCRFIYQAYDSGATSPIQSALSLVSFYQGSDYSEETASSIVDGIQVLNSIPDGIGTDISSIVSATVGSGVATPAKPLVSVSNVSVNDNVIDFIASIGYEGTTYGQLSLNNITVKKLTTAAVSTNGTDTNFDIVATGIMNIDGVTTPANSKPFVTTSTGVATFYNGLMQGSSNQGFNSSYRIAGSDNNRAPMLFGDALAGPTGTSGGVVSVQTASIADDGTHEFDERFYTNNRGLFAVSVNYEYNSQGLFAAGSDQIHEIAAYSPSVFDASITGSNPDTDGKFNMWFTGGKLNVKNRLGGSYVVTVIFMG